MQSHLRELLTKAIEKTAKGGELNSTELPPLLLEPPKQREFGDLATNAAMLWAKSAKKPPRMIAETILKNIEDPDGILARKEIAGSGFLNFTFAPKFYYAQLRELAAGNYDRVDFGHGERVQVEFAEGGYPGDYVKEIAAAVKQRQGDKYLNGDEQAAVSFFREYGGESLLDTIRAQLREFGIQFDAFFSERAMRERSEVAQAIEVLRARGLLYSQEGAEWYKSTQFGDDKDRAVIKSDGELTYFASDIAYHRNKYERKFHKLINVWGADHHGYVRRLKAAVQGLGYDPNVLKVVLVQMVQLTRKGEPVRMGKRTGEFVSLEEVLEEVGRDAARFFFLMRKSDSHLDFDLDLAKQQSSDNPVFYVQYAHARVASIFEQASKNGLEIGNRAIVSVERLELAEELELIRKMIQFNDVVEESVLELEPHRVVFYLLDLAGEFHRYYNRYRVISEDSDLSRARLLLVENVQKTIRRGLDILGVGAPLKMAARSEA